MMITKNERFKRWKKENVSLQQSVMNTAELVSAYLKKIHSAQIKQDINLLTQKSSDFTPIYKRPRYRRGVHLFCMLDVDEAIDLLSTKKEHSVLVALKDDLVALFNSYKDKPGQRIPRILANLDVFFKIQATDFSNIEKAKELYYSFYLMLSVILHSLVHLPPGSGSLAYLYGVSLNKTQIKVEEMLLCVENNIKIVDALAEKKKQSALEEPTAMKQGLEHEFLVEDNDLYLTKEFSLKDELLKSQKNVSQKLIQKSQKNELNLEPHMPIPEQTIIDLQYFIQNSFNAHYSALIDSKVPVAEKLSQLLALSNSVVENLELLNAERIKEQTVLQQKKIVTELFEAFVANDNKIAGRLYFHELKQRHSEAIDLLLALSSGATKDALVVNLERQEQNANSKTAKGLYALSTVFFPFTVLSRAFLREQTQQYIASWSPETDDAQAKSLVKKLALEVLDNLKQKKEDIGLEKIGFQVALAKENNPLAGMIADQPSENLVRLVDLNKIQNNYDTLVARLKIKEIHSVSVKTLIQDALQERYSDLMQETDNEKAKVNSLINSMRGVVKELTVLIELKASKKELLSKIYSLEALFEVVNPENNQLGALINNSIKNEQVKADALDTKIHASIGKLAQGNSLLEEHLLCSPVEDLHELVLHNTVSTTIDSKLLSLVPPVLVPEPKIVDEKTVQEYFNDCTRELLNHDSNEEEKRLAHVVECIDNIDKNIKIILTEREKYQKTVAKEQLLRSVVEVLERDNTNAFLVSFSKERLVSLSNEAVMLHTKIDAAAHSLAHSNPSLRQLVLQESSTVLQAVIGANEVTRECIKHYKCLKDSILLLNEMKKGTSVLDSYIAQNNTWWVRLTQFLARFCSLFKSQAGEMMDKANSLKSELLECRRQCEQEINICMAKVKNDSNLGNDLLGDLSEQYHSVEADVLPLVEPFDPNKAVSLLSEVSMFNPKHKIRESSHPSDLRPKVVEEEEIGYGYC